MTYAYYICAIELLAIVRDILFFNPKKIDWDGFLDKRQILAYTRSGSGWEAHKAGEAERCP